jgi:putative transposase
MARYRHSMARMLRRDLPDGIYHVTARGVAHASIFRDDRDRAGFLGILAEVVDRYAWRCHAFCLMGTHYHLVVETTRAQLSAGLQRLNGTYAQRFNRRHGRSGHLFGARFSSWLIETERHMRDACLYVVMNPVRAGLCEDAGEWRWSHLRRGLHVG